MSEGKDEMVNMRVLKSTRNRLKIQAVHADKDLYEHVDDLSKKAEK